MRVVKKKSITTMTRKVEGFPNKVKALSGSSVACMVSQATPKQAQYRQLGLAFKTKWPPQNSTDYNSLSNIVHAFNFRDTTVIAFT